MRGRAAERALVLACERLRRGKKIKGPAAEELKTGWKKLGEKHSYENELRNRASVHDAHSYTWLDAVKIK